MAGPGGNRFSWTTVRIPPPWRASRSWATGQRGKWHAPGHQLRDYGYKPRRYYEPSPSVTTRIRARLRRSAGVITTSPRKTRGEWHGEELGGTRHCGGNRRCCVDNSHSGRGSAWIAPVIVGSIISGAVVGAARASPDYYVYYGPYYQPYARPYYQGYAEPTGNSRAHEQYAEPLRAICGALCAALLSAIRSAALLSTLRAALLPAICAVLRPATCTAYTTSHMHGSYDQPYARSYDQPYAQLIRASHMAGRGQNIWLVVGPCIWLVVGPRVRVIVALRMADRGPRVGFGILFVGGLRILLVGLRDPW